MKNFPSIPCLLACVCLATAASTADAQAIGDETVVISPPPTIAPGGPVVIKERRKLFHPRARVYVVKPRSRRISVPATVIGPAASPATIVEAPAPIVGRPEIVAEPPADLDEPRSKAPNLDQPDGEVGYQAPKVISTPRSASGSRSTPR